jgi:hypothetical protein
MLKRIISLILIFICISCSGCINDKQSFRNVLITKIDYPDAWSGILTTWIELFGKMPDGSNENFYIVCIPQTLELFQIGGRYDLSCDYQDIEAQIGKIPVTRKILKAKVIIDHRLIKGFENNLPRSFQRYQLALLQTFKTSVILQDEDIWRKALISKYKCSYAVYMKTDLIVKDHGRISAIPIYQNLKKKDQFLVKTDRNIAIVDFGEKLVGTAGCGGIEFFYHKNGRMVFCYNYASENLFCVPVGSPKSESVEPVFLDKQVYWTWPPEK